MNNIFLYIYIEENNDHLIKVVVPNQQEQIGHNVE